MKKENENTLINMHELNWILKKFLRESLDFLINDEIQKSMNKNEWVNRWIEGNIPNRDKWIPDQSHYINKEKNDG